MDRPRHTSPIPVTDWIGFPFAFLAVGAGTIASVEYGAAPLLPDADLRWTLAVVCGIVATVGAGFLVSVLTDNDAVLVSTLSFFAATTFSVGMAAGSGAGPLIALFCIGIAVLILRLSRTRALVALPPLLLAIAAFAVILVVQRGSVALGVAAGAGAIAVPLTLASRRIRRTRALDSR